MAMPVFSAIIPSYNHARFLPCAIESIKSQTFQDWEVIIVDDGSTDDTAAVAAQFADPRIRYIYQANSGLSAARNTGLRHARGAFVALLDADDLWLPAFLERTLDTFSRDRFADATYCGFRYMDSEGALLGQSVCRTVAPEMLYDAILRGSWIICNSVVVRASVYREVGPFDTSLSACEDLDMWLRICHRSRMVGILEVLVLYRRSGSNMSDDPDRMTRALTTLLELHLGTLSEPMSTWSATKYAAVSDLYSGIAQRYLAAGRFQESAEGVEWLLKHNPTMGESLDLWYSLACVHQPVGERGDYRTWNAERGEGDVWAVIAALSRGNVPRSMQRRVRSEAHLALAWLRYGQGNGIYSRDHLWKSVQDNPGIAFASRWQRLAMRAVALDILKGRSNGRKSDLAPG